MVASRPKDAGRPTIPAGSRLVRERAFRILMDEVDGEDDSESMTHEELLERLRGLVEMPVDVEWRYEVARADFRLRRGDQFRPCVAVIVDAAFLLADPAGVQFLGQNPDAASAYDAVAARVWHRLCDAWMELARAAAISADGDDDESSGDESSGDESPDDESGPFDGDAAVEVPSEIILRIVQEHMCEEFGGDAAGDAVFAEIITGEFGAEAAAGLATWSEASSVADLIYAGLSTLPGPRVGG